ncbi:MAG: pilin [Limnobacter sp.]|uniref:pilin n=1 Tax=Limnobacter sp. TaxID=2003368 RepID=UPI0032ECBD3F
MNTLTTFKRAKDTQGFTLIELMIAIAIVGVLATIAIPQFTDYLGRARVSEAVNLAQGCKTGFVEFNATRGVFPTTAAMAGCNNTPTENVASLAVAGGTTPGITVALAAAAPVPPAVRGHNIILEPLGVPASAGAAPPLATAGGVIANWRCRVTTGTGTAPAQAALNMVPASCR